MIVPLHCGGAQVFLSGKGEHLRGEFPDVFKLRITPDLVEYPPYLPYSLPLVVGCGHSIGGSCAKLAVALKVESRKRASSVRRHQSIFNIFAVNLASLLERRYTSHGAGFAVLTNDRDLFAPWYIPNRDDLHHQLLWYEAD